MAQVKRSSAKQKLRVIARRFGISTGASIAMVGVALIVAVGAASTILGLRGSGLSIERGEGLQPVQSEPVVPKDNADDVRKSADVISSDESLTVVHVDGAVANPGVYVLEGSGQRVNDAVECAGGILPDADTSTLNLAATIEDGQKVHVPFVDETPSQINEPSSGNENSHASSNYDLININTASEAELCTLPGVGEATAAAIVRERTQNGSFSSPEDIMRVSGIGEKKFAKMQELICV